MATVRFKIDPQNPPALSPETVSRLDAMTPNEVEENARTDLANPPWTDEELKAAQIGRYVRQVRAARGLTQVEFSKKYGMAVGRLRDWEQGRFKPDAMTLAYLATIEHEPEAVARALEKLRPAA